MNSRVEVAKYVVVRERRNRIVVWTDGWIDG